LADEAGAEQGAERSVAELKELACAMLAAGDACYVRRLVARGASRSQVRVGVNVLVLARQMEIISN
jgi:hypothetical protein